MTHVDLVNGKTLTVEGRQAQEIRELLRGGGRTDLVPILTVAGLALVNPVHVVQVYETPSS